MTNSFNIPSISHIKSIGSITTGIEEILNFQPKQGKAKAYQVKQVRDVILKYQLGGQDED
jgi:hypothetical protein